MFPRDPKVHKRWKGPELYLIKKGSKEHGIGENALNNYETF